MTASTVPVVPTLTFPLPSPRKEPVVATHRPCEIIPFGESVVRGAARTCRVRSDRQSRCSNQPATDRLRVGSPKMSSREHRTPVLMAYSKALHTKTDGSASQWGRGPSPTGCFRLHKTPRRGPETAVTGFQAYYSRAGLPFRIKHGTRKTIQWEMPPDTIDYSVVLPVFVDGLREVSQPYDFMAYEGALELVRRGGDDRVLPVIPKLILPLKRALNSKDPRVMRKALHLLQVLVKSGELIGESLVPYYRQLLPIFNVFKRQKNMGDHIDFKIKRNIGALIEETLVVLETHGGEDAFINIKYMIPTYESRVLN